MGSTGNTLLIGLSGTPAEVGRAFGKANASDIRAEVGKFFGDGSRRDAQLRATEHYRNLVRQHAPHWLDEAAALAAAAGVGTEEYLAYQGAKYRGINRGDCFTYFAAPRHTIGGVTLFHKNRDNRNRPQAAYVKDVKTSGRRVFRFAATGDTSDMGTMMGVNEKGLACAADTGARDPNPRFKGMMNPDTMRLVLEQAENVNQAHEMLKQHNADKIYAGGKIATNWMFADATGQALRVVQFHESLVPTPDRNGLHVMRDNDARGRLVTKELSDLMGKVSARTMNRLSRTAPVLHKTNISAMTAEIPRERPDLFTCAHFAAFHAGRTIYVPVYLGATATPRPLVDGTIYRLSTPKADGFGAGAAAFEAELNDKRLRQEVRAKSFLAKGNEQAARRVLTEIGGELAARVAERLT